MHHALRIAVPFARTPAAQLFLEIGCALSDERRVALALAQSIGPMARSARFKTARSGTLVIKAARFGGQANLTAIACAFDRLSPGCFCGETLIGIILCHGQSLLAGKSPRKPAHLRMAALAVCKETELSDEVSRIQASNARDKITVTGSIYAMAGVACRLWPRITAGQGDQFSGVVEPVVDR